MFVRNSRRPAYGSTTALSLTRFQDEGFPACVLPFALMIAIGVALATELYAADGSGRERASANLASSTAAPPTVPSFHREVMAVLSRVGCNQGACHGNLNGKGGFRLSLRGEDARFDYFSLTHDERGRRVDRVHPIESLILRKPATQVPHEGGQVLIPGSHEYDIIVDWIRGGTPPPREGEPALVDLQVTPRDLTVRDLGQSVTVTATAVFEDGQRRDVTRLATFETTNFVAVVDQAGVVRGRVAGEASVGVRYLDQQRSVRVAFLDPVVAAETGETLTGREAPHDRPPLKGHWIDRHVFRKLETLSLPRPALASDTVFVRRAYLDTQGRLPTGDEAKRFVLDESLDKRERLIDHLLTTPDFADFWALKWSDVLRNEEKLLDKKGVEQFHQWIRSAMVDDMPLDQFAHALISARGSTYDYPPANFYRALRDPTVRAESTARLFLGVRLQCAKCHNHPFDRWKQDDYYSWARVFSGIEYEIVENNRKDRLDKSEFIGEQRITVKLGAPLTNARTREPAVAQFLGESNRPDPEADLLYAVADWVTRDNDQFARAQANRIWYHMLGRGLVDPVDDFRVTNPASHPELLEALAQELQQSGFRLRHLVKAIMLSRTYQAATIGNDERALDSDNYAGIKPRRLSAEQLLDSQTQVLGVSAKFNGYDSGIRAVQLAGVQRVRFRDSAPSEDDRFLTLFGKPQRLMNCECERSDNTTLTQALYLVSGPALHQRLESSDNQLSQWVQAGLSNEQLIERLYWSTLSRKPTVQEREAFLQHLVEVDNRLAGLRDAAWALMNAKEFLFRP